MSSKEDTGGAEVLRIEHDVEGTDPFLDKVDEVSIKYYVVKFVRKIAGENSHDLNLMLLQLSVHKSQ